jgi:hypothetical protein
MGNNLPRLTPTNVGPGSRLNRSQRYLASAYDSVASLLEETYPALRAQRTGSRGRRTHAEQDVFRAAVVFAGAGVDTVFKEAMRGCIAIQIERSDGAREKYLDFVTRSIQEGQGVGPRQLANLLIQSDPSAALKAAYVEQLTGSSLQSVSQVTNAMSALGLGDERNLYKEARTLNDLFRARNQIAHELDMTPASAGGRGARTRRERSSASYIAMCHGALDFAQGVLNSLEQAVG